MWKIAVVVQILFFLLLGYNFYESAIKVEKMEFLSEKLLQLEREKNGYMNVIAYFYRHEGAVENNYLGKDENGTDISLKELVRKYGRLKVFKYKLSDCSQCVNKVLEKLGEIKKKNNLLIISDFKSYSYMKFLKEKYEGLLFLRVKEIADSAVTPCFFQIDNERKITDFLYISTNDNILPSYLRELDRKDSLILCSFLK